MARFFSKNILIKIRGKTFLPFLIHYKAARDLV